MRFQTVRKFGNTLRVCWRVLTARTFGQYRHSSWDQDGEYALYIWRGDPVRVPLLPNRNDF